MDKEQRNAIVEQYGLHEGDTGSTEVQVAILTTRIRQLTEHLKKHRHDHNTERGLYKLIGRRKRLMTYLWREDRARYQALVVGLGLRK
jgi:small subunit ribosomal protein S15